MDGKAPRARRFVVGDLIRVHLQDWISDGTVRAVIIGKDGFRFLDGGCGEPAGAEVWNS
jgi:hypothetical protein